MRPLSACGPYISGPKSRPEVGRGRALDTLRPLIDSADLEGCAIVSVNQDIGGEVPRCHTRYSVDQRPLPNRVWSTLLAVAIDYDISVPDIIGRDRHRLFAYARLDAAWRLRQLRFADGRPPSYPRIAVWLERDHSTIVSNVQAWEREMRKDEAARVYQMGGW